MSNTFYAPHTSNTTIAVVDVVVVGAGLSGLTAAWRLKKAGKKVLVLEARSRVGGKVYDKKLACGGIIELGAAYVGPYQDRILALMKELDVTGFAHYDVGKNVYHDNDSRIVYSDGELPLPDATLSQLGAATESLNTMSKQLDAQRPWEHSEAVNYDSKTLQTWLQQTITDTTARHLITATVRALLSAEPTDVSLLQFLAYIRRAGNEVNVGTFARLTGIAGSAQESRIRGGPQLIATRLAERLRDSIRLNSPVTEIALNNGMYHVKGKTFTCSGKAVVLALSPPLAIRIDYHPPLPADRDQMCQHMPMGSLGKVFAIYDDPFWRADGLSGKAVGLRGSTIQTTFDSSPEDGSCGAIIGFLEADAMRKLDSASEDEIRRLVLKDLVAYFGPRAKNVREWVIQRWDNEQYSRGGHFAICPPNAMTRFGEALTQSIGNMYFAGTEASPYWAGFMDGAVRAGEIAADAILESTSVLGTSRL